MNSGIPKVSVLMAVYNGEKYLRESIESILGQTFRDFEFVIIDDCSTDSTPDILAEYANSDQRIRVLRSRANLRLAKSLNVGIAAARGEYIARQDDDDVWLPTRLAEQVSYMDEHPETQLVASAAHFIDDRGARVGFRPAVLGACELTISMTLYNPIIHSSVMFRAATARELNGYSEEECCRFSEDSEFWPRIARCGNIVTLSEPLVEYRVHPSSVSAANKGEQNQQAACIARACLKGILGREVDDQAWSVWWRFNMTNPTCMVTFKAGEVASLHLLVSGLIRGVKHDRGGQCKLPLIWAKHALALALLRRGNINAYARLRLAYMALHIGAEALVAHL